MASATSAGGGVPTITVLGSLNMDLVSYVAHHPEPGETMTSSGFAVSPGGKGANQAVACAKLSRARPRDDGGGDAHRDPDPGATAHVCMVGAVGDDAHGAALRASLARQGVDVAGVRVLGTATTTTGVAVVIVDEPTGQNRIIVSPGANHAAAWTSAAAAALVPAATRLLVLQLEVPLDLVLRAVGAARAAGLPVLLNPAPAPATEAERAQLEAAAFPGLAHLVLNETEAAALVPGLAVADLDAAAGRARAARYFLARGVAHVVVTLGGRGVYYATAATAEAAETAAAAGSDAAADPGVLVPAEPVARVVDTTAAGDTFVGQYALEAAAAAAAGRRLDCGAAVRKANRAAARTVQRKGAQDSIPWRDEVGAA